jgi:hypothetical protein
MVRQDHKAFKAYKAYKVHRALPVLQAQPDPLAHKAILAQPDLQVLRQRWLVLQALQDLLEHKVIMGLQVHKVFKVYKEYRVTLDLLDRKVTPATPVRLVPQGLLVI